MAPTRRKDSSEGHRFGGDWTAQKLDIIASYLEAYTTALKDKPSKEQPFAKAYIDAFAGTGYVDQADERGEGLLFPDLAAPESQKLLEGSAVRALKTEPRFDRYIFIERNAARCVELESLKQKFPALAPDIRINQGDANLRLA